MSVVGAVFDEDEFAFGVVGRDGVDGGLNAFEIARAVGGGSDVRLEAGRQCGGEDAVVCGKKYGCDQKMQRISAWVSSFIPSKKWAGVKSETCCPAFNEVSLADMQEQLYH